MGTKRGSRVNRRRLIQYSTSGSQTVAIGRCGRALSLHRLIDDAVLGSIGFCCLGFLLSGASAPPLVPFVPTFLPDSGKISDERS